MDNYDLLVETTITRNISTLTKPSYNIAALFSSDTPLTGFTTNKTKLYTDIESIKKDFGNESTTAKIANAYFAQNPKGRSLRIVKRGSAVATVKTITYNIDFTNGVKINGIVNGVALEETTFNTNQSTTINAVATKIAGIVGVASATASGKVITVTGSSGASLSLDSFEVSGVTPQVTATIETTTAGYNLSNDLSEAMIENNDFYVCLVTTTTINDIMTGAAAIEALPKIGVFITTDVKTYDALETSDPMYQTKIRGYNRSAVIFHTAPAEGLAAAITSRNIGVDAGIGMWAAKTVNGVSVSSLDKNQIKNIRNKNGNCYIMLGSSGGFYEGTMASGLSIELIRDTDYSNSEITIGIFDLIKQAEKISYDLDGRTTVETRLNEIMKRLASEKVIQPNYTITPPDLSLISVSDKNNHILPNFQFTAELVKGVKKVLIKGSMY